MTANVENIELKSEFKLPPKKQRGAVEISTITLLVILAAVALMAALLYPTIMYQWKKTSFTSQYSQLVGAAQSWKGARSSYAGISLVNLCNEHQLPANSEFCTAAATSNPFGGAWTVAAAANTSQVLITATNIPAANGANLVRDMATTVTAVLAGTTLSLTQ